MTDGIRFAQTCDRASGTCFIDITREHQDCRADIAEDVANLFKLGLPRVFNVTCSTEPAKAVSRNPPAPFPGALLQQWKAPLASCCAYEEENVQNLEKLRRARADLEGLTYVRMQCPWDGHECSWTNRPVQRAHCRTKIRGNWEGFPFLTRGNIGFLVEESGVSMAKLSWLAKNAGRT